MVSKIIPKILNLPKIIKQLACICKHGFKKKRLYSEERR